MPPLAPLTLTTPVAKQWYRNYKRNWDKCINCTLHQHADKHVYFRGTLPADLLLLGEAPGKTEDRDGFPFIGLAGDVLNELLRQTQQKLDEKHKICFTYVIGNICCCIPYAVPGKPEEGVRAPLPQEAAACRPHLEELLFEFNFKGIVLLGRTAQEHSQPLFDRNSSLFSALKILNLYHPAYLLRRGGSSPNNKEFKNSVQQLADFVVQVVPASKPQS